MRRVVVCTLATDNSPPAEIDGSRWPALAWRMIVPDTPRRYRMREQLYKMALERYGQRHGFDPSNTIFTPEVNFALSWHALQELTDYINSMAVDSMRDVLPTGDGRQ